MCGNSSADRYRKGEIWYGEVWHNKIVPHFAMVFKDRSHLLGAVVAGDHKQGPVQNH